MMGTCLCNLVLQNRVEGVLLQFLKKKRQRQKSDDFDKLHFMVQEGLNEKGGLLLGNTRSLASVPEGSNAMHRRGQTHMSICVCVDPATKLQKCFKVQCLGAAMGLFLAVYGFTHVNWPTSGVTQPCLIQNTCLQR